MIALSHREHRPRGSPGHRAAVLNSGVPPSAETLQPKRNPGAVRGWPRSGGYCSGPRRRRDKFAANIDAVDEQIRMMGGIARRPIIGRRGRRSNKVTLAVALSQVLKDKTMRVTDAADAVRAAGYKTGSRSSRVQVNIARIKNPKLFRRAGRGLCMAN